MIRSNKQDLFEAPDYYLVNELFNEEHKMVRDAVRKWVKKELSPVIEDHAQRAEFPRQLLPGLAGIGAFGPTVPPEYGGGGLDAISYGLMMQELERGDSGIRSTASVQGSLVMYPLRSEEHTSELQSLMRISYAVFCLKKKKKNKEHTTK